MGSAKGGNFMNPKQWSPPMGRPELENRGFSLKPTKHRPKDPPADWFATMRARRRLP